jgi:hypothetical protein
MTDTKKQPKKFSFGDIKKEPKKGIYEGDTEQTTKSKETEKTGNVVVAAKAKKETKKKKPGRKAKDPKDRIAKNMVGVYFSDNELEKLKGVSDGFIGNLAPSAIIRLLLQKHEYI